MESQGFLRALSWGGLANFDFGVVLVLVTSAAMLSSFRYSVMPRISFATTRDTLISITVLTVLVSVVLYPDEVFFPMGIIYLLSGPVRALTVPAYHHVAHRVQNR